MAGKPLSARRAPLARPPQRRLFPRPSVGWTWPVLHLLFVYSLTLFDLQFLLGTLVAQPLVYIVHLGYPPLLLMMALRGPEILMQSKGWVWFAPLLILLIVAGVTMPFAANQMLAKQHFQYYLIYYSISLATAVYIREPRQALPILAMLFAQYAWFGLFARTGGLVPWHPTLSNYDGFAGLMVQGVGLCYWFALATPSRKLKLFLYLSAAYCVLGVVASFARGAFLSLLVVVAWIWVRSPRKVMTGLSVVGASLVVVVGASLMFEPGFFWNEISSAFEEGTEEGTGAQRWNLWQAGFKVWLERPILGVGGSNFGAFAASHFKFGELEAFPNPNMLYGYNLHNSYVQVLSEFGVIGFIAFAWAAWDFWKRNRQLRSPEARHRWAEATGGRWDLQYLALGLEAANIANLLGGLLYASLLMPWFYIIWIVNRMLWAVTRPPEQAATPPRRASQGRRVSLAPGASPGRSPPA